MLRNMQVRALAGHASEAHILFRDLQGALAAQRALNGAFIPSLTGADPFNSCSFLTPTAYCAQALGPWAHVCLGAGIPHHLLARQIMSVKLLAASPKL